MRLAQRLRAFKTTEKVSKAQLALLLEELAHKAPESHEVREEQAPPHDELIDRVAEERERLSKNKTKPPKQKPCRKPFPDTLERVDNPLSIPAEERPCPICKNERRCSGHDVTEVLELIPAQVIVRRDLREKLVCDVCEKPQFSRAPRGDRVVEGGRFGPSIVANILVDKYRDGLPLHRQVERFERLGVPLSVSTLADQIGYGTELLQPLWRGLQLEALDAEVLHLDGTSLPFFQHRGKGKDKKAQKKLGALWGFVGDDHTALYLFAPSGHASFSDEHTIGPADFLGLREGLAVADAAGVFDKAFEREGIIECGCNMHARRYFVKALDRGDGRAALAIDAYQILYGIEREARDLELGPAERLALRQERSAPIFSRLLKWAASLREDEAPSSPLGRAVGYLLNQQEPLARFLEDGRVPIANGAVERLHVRAALTRKNFLFAGSERGAQSAAVMFSILGSCALVGVDPVQYLSNVIPILARGIVQKDVKSLLPAYFASA